MGVVRVTWPIF